MLLTIQTINVI